MSSPQQTYHLEELRIAQDATDKRRSLPEIPPGCRSILDVGCGAGQTLIGMQPAEDIRLYGIDVDEEALALGAQLSSRIAFRRAPGEKIPFPEQFDLLICRTSLQYMDVRRAIAEFARVLSPNGTLWMTLLPLRKVLERLGRGILRGNPKEALFCSYSLANGLWFAATGRQFRLGQRSELFHVRWRIRRELKRAGFSDISIRRAGRHHVVVARY